MDLILWRHCDAEPGVPDELRRLTPLGWKQAQRVAQWLATRLPAGCRILVSPAVRAQQTAGALGRIHETVAALAPGAGIDDVLRVAGWPDAAMAALVVGHEPALGAVAGYLLGEAGERPLGKGAVVWLRADAAGDAALAAEMRPDLVTP
jgi:phosphohistidine phosphatase